MFNPSTSKPVFTQLPSSIHHIGQALLGVVVVSTSAWHVRSSDQACYNIRCKNLALDSTISRDCVSLAGRVAQR